MKIYDLENGYFAFSKGEKPEQIQFELADREMALQIQLTKDDIKELIKELGTAYWSIK